MLRASHKSVRSAAIIDLVRSITLVLAGIAAILAPAFEIRVGVAFVAVAALLARFRGYSAMDGADSMLVVAWIAAAALDAAKASRDGTLMRWSVLLTIGILGAAYFESGIVKLCDSGWRSGWSIARIMSVPEFGTPGLARLLGRHRSVRIVASWATILIELTGGLLFIAGGPFALCAVIVLTSLHVTIAVAMGLGRFFWGFESVLIGAYWGRGFL